VTKNSRCRWGTSPMRDVLLAASKIRKTYTAVTALDNVGIELRSGEIHAIVGENGSGKSTLLCRVHGLTGLRIVDASVFPSIPQAMTNAATIAVAERASDIILGRDEPEEERRLSEENEGTRLATTDSSMAGTATH
jgi:Fe-S cluster assembly ATPase SufC